MQDFDVVVIGAGVAGLTAAIHAARHGLGVVVVDQTGVGGQVVNVERIENLPGFPAISGIELGPVLQEQAEAAGAEFMLDAVESVEAAGARWIVRGAEELRGRAVIVATGSSLRSLGVPGEERLRGKGVSHCASCDGPLFRNRHVCVIGGGDSALDEALALAEHAGRVTLIHRGEMLSAQKTLQDRAAAEVKIEVLLNSTVEEILGEETVSAVRLLDHTGKVERVQETSGVFVYVGLRPNTSFLRGLVRLDSAGHIETDIMMQTSVAGIFAAGDIRAHSVAQLAAVAGDGATAAMAAVHYLRSHD